MTLPPLREVIAAHGIGARKSLGQNFLFDLNLTRRIVRAAGVCAGDTVYEVGPGPGGLTRALLEEDGVKVVCVEKDERCIAALADIAAAYPGRLTVIEGDALEIDEAALFTGGPVKLVANLPYNVATPLLVKWLSVETWPPWYASMTIMFQREVAERIAASPGGRDYGRLSVLAGWRTTAKRLFDVPPSAFVPPPKVTSSIVQLTPRPAPAAPADLVDLQTVVKAAFSQRRKMLRSSLKSLGFSPDALGEAAGIALDRRAETLSVEEFCALARAFSLARATS